MSHAFVTRMSGNLIRSNSRNLTPKFANVAVSCYWGPWVITTRQRSQERGNIVIRRTPRVIFPNSLQYYGFQILQVRWKGGYSDFGHNPKPTSLFTVLWTGFLVSVMIGVFIDWKMLWEMVREKVKPPKVDAAEVYNLNCADNEESMGPDLKGNFS